MAGLRWHDFFTGTPAKLSEVNNNFAWLQGHLIPQASGSGVINTYDLGTSTAKWRNVNVAHNLVLNGVTMSSVDNSTLKVSTGVFFIGTSSVLGSTGNTNGTQQYIVQGTVDERNIKSDAVHIITNAGTVPSSLTLPTSTASGYIDCSITTSGYPVLVNAAVTVSIYAATSDLSFRLDVWRVTGGSNTALTGAFAIFHLRDLAAFPGFQEFPMGVSILDRPSAGLHTYRAWATRILAGTTSAIAPNANSSVIAIEVKN